MNDRSKPRWIAPTLLLLAAFAIWVAACESDGVTPNCPPDGGDCLTPPGDANPPTPDGGN